MDNNRQFYMDWYRINNPISTTNSTATTHNSHNIQTAKYGSNLRINSNTVSQLGNIIRKASSIVTEGQQFQLQQGAGSYQSQGEIIDVKPTIIDDMPTIIDNKPTLIDIKPSVPVSNKMDFSVFTVNIDSDSESEDPDVILPDGDNSDDPQVGSFDFNSIINMENSLDVKVNASASQIVVPRNDKIETSSHTLLDKPSHLISQEIAIKEFHQSIRDFDAEESDCKQGNVSDLKSTQDDFLLYNIDRQRFAVTVGHLNTLRNQCHSRIILLMRYCANPGPCVCEKSVQRSKHIQLLIKSYTCRSVEIDEEYQRDLNYIANYPAYSDALKIHLNLQRHKQHATVIEPHLLNMISMVATFIQEIQEACKSCSSTLSDGGKDKALVDISATMGYNILGTVTERDNKANQKGKRKKRSPYKKKAKESTHSAMMEEIQEACKSFSSSGGTDKALVDIISATMDKNKLAERQNKANQKFKRRRGPNKTKPKDSTHSALDLPSHSGTFPYPATYPSVDCFHSTPSQIQANHTYLQHNGKQTSQQQHQYPARQQQQYPQVPQPNQGHGIDGRRYRLLAPKSVNIPRTLSSQIGVPHTQIGVPHTQIGAPHTQIRVPQSQIGVPHTQLGVPHTQLGVSHRPIGVPHNQLGVSHRQISVPHTPIGVPDTQLGESHTQIGVPNTQIGVSQTHIGVPYTQIRGVPQFLYQTMPL